MNELAGTLRKRRGSHIREAVLRHPGTSRDGFSERLFAWLFSGLVYPQIWEDPEVDMKAMELAEGHRVVTIASGGCNVLSYLSRSPALIDAVDLNEAHIALNRLKLAAVRHLPGHADLMRLLASTGQRHNALAYERFVGPHLDARSRRYWERRRWNGRRRIDAFNGNFYRQGLLGWFIAAGHAAARLHGVDPVRLMEAISLRAQRAFFDTELVPLFDKPLIRFLLGWKASLFGLGIPPAQYEALSREDAADAIATVLRERLAKLACQFPLKENYFAWQAFARRYPGPEEGTLPLYLQKPHFETIRANADRVAVHHASITTLLASKPAASVDRFVLLDAQDWMTDEKLNALWSEITRTAAPGARAIFRTAGRASILPGRLSPSLIGQWSYEEAASAEGLGNDRSAIYGGFHVYRLKDR